MFKRKIETKTEIIEVSKIDALVNEFEQLKITRQKIDDDRKHQNKEIDTQINSLIAKGALIKDEADSKIAEIDRKLAKLKKQIILEKEYSNSVVESLTKVGM